MQNDCKSKPDVVPLADKKSTRAKLIVKTIVVVERAVKIGRWLDQQFGISEWLANL